MANAKAKSNTPACDSRPHFRFTATKTTGLAPGTVTANAQVNYEIVPLAGALTVSVRLKATNTGNLDLFAVGPDFDVTQADDNVAFGSLVGTIYSTGNPTAVPIVAGTEAVATYTGKGERYLLIKFSGTAAGVITYCDVSTLMQSGV